MKKYLYFLLSLFMSVTMVACGGDDDDNDNSPGSNASSNQAWIGTTYSDGEAIDVIITFDTQSTGKFRLVYDKIVRFYDFSYETIDGKIYLTIHGGDVSKAVMVINGNTASYFSGSDSATLYKESLNSYYQNWYDRVESTLIENYNTYLAGDKRMPWLYLEAAKANQNELIYIHNAAASDGVSLRISDWETKNLE